MTKALYRKHRPAKLDKVIGQEHITDILQKSLKNGKISHAYLFIGPRGTGKTSVARILAHQINKFDYQLEDDHLDIIEIDAASNTGVDHIRTLRENAAIAPTSGQYKIYIIDEVHMLSRSAFNALLKTLEEPPQHVIFIMATTDAHKVPVTITSRSQTYTFKLVHPDTIASHLAEIAKIESINIAPEALQVIAKRGRGSFRDAISILDQISTLSDTTISANDVNAALGLPSDQLTADLLDQYTNAAPAVHQTLQVLLDQGVKPEIIAEDLIAHILANPKPQLHPLLNQLTEVPGSTFPEVKLLLALFGNQPVPNPIPPTSSSSPPSPSSPSSSPQSTTPPPNPAPTPPEPTPPPTPTPNFTTWPDLLAHIKQDNPATHSLLLKSSAELTPETLKIYHKTPMVRKKIQTKQSYLASLLPENTTIQILDQPLHSDPLITDLSSIFGAVEELPQTDEINL